MRLTRRDMHQRRIPFLRSLIGPLFLLLVGCPAQRGEPVDFKILSSGGNISITLRNNTNRPLTVHDQLVGGPKESPILIEVKDRSGATVNRCGSLDYFEAASLVNVAPGATATLVVPASTIPVAHCLRSGTEYRIRFGYIDQNDVASFSRWTAFHDSFDAE